MDALARKIAVIVLAYSLGLASGIWLQSSNTEFSNTEVVAETNATIQVHHSTTIPEEARPNASLDWFKADGKFIWDDWKIK